MSYRATLERIKKLEESEGTPLTKRTESPLGSSVSSPSRQIEYKSDQTFESLREEVVKAGKAFVVTVKDGRIRMVRDAKPIDPDRIVAIWDFRRVRIGKNEWMIGTRQDGKEDTWRLE